MNGFQTGQNMFIVSKNMPSALTIYTELQKSFTRRLGLICTYYVHLVSTACPLDAN